MVEVLVALVILSVGLLGTATLYVTTMQSKASALSRMQAVNLTADLADRIRANRTARDAYEIASNATAAAPAENCVQTADEDASECTPAQLAATDLFLWSAQVTTTLGSTATRSVDVDETTSPTTYTIQIDWTEPSLGNLSHVLTVQI